MILLALPVSSAEEVEVTQQPIRRQNYVVREQGHFAASPAIGEVTDVSLHPPLLLLLLVGLAYVGYISPSL